MTPFRDRPKTCPKCGGEPGPWYVSTDGCSYGCKIREEHLHWRCEACGFRIGATAAMNADPEPEAAFVPPRGEVKIRSNVIDKWYAYAKWVVFDSTRGWIHWYQGNGSRYPTREACEKAVDAWYAKHAPAPVKQPETAVEQPKGEGAASGAGDGLEWLRKAIIHLLGMMAKDCDGNVSPRNAYRHAVDVVEGDFEVARRRLVAFDRRDFELLEKHDIWPYRKHPHADFNTSNYPDYLTALRAAIAEARRREGEVQDER